MREILLSDLLDGPSPGLEESRQIHSHNTGEGFSIQVHLSLVVVRKVAHLKVASKNLLEGFPAKLFLQLQQRRRRKATLFIFMLYDQGREIRQVSHLQVSLQSCPDTPVAQLPAVCNEFLHPSFSPL